MVTLERCSLFSLLGSAELDSLRQAARERRYDAGQIVFREGDAGDGLYIVKEGVIEISSLVGSANRRVLSRVEPGDVFGEMAVVEDRPRSATATALEAATLFFFARGDMLEMVRRSPNLSLALLRGISSRLREFNHHHLREVIQSERLAVVGRFARSIVHDLKNPLHIIGLSAELLDMEKDDEARREHIEHIGEQVTRINDLVGEILDFAQGSSSAFVMSAMDYGPFLQESAAQLRAEAGMRQVTLELCEPIPDAAVLMNPKRLRRVFP